jgi:signal transduction histidine kinase
MALYLANQTIPATLLVLQLVATLGAVVQLGLSARSIHLRPAELAERMLKVQEDERQHLGRELHDDIGQLLTAAKLQLQWLQRRMPDDLQGHCEALRSTLDDTLGNVRDVSALLNPGSWPALAWKPACARTWYAPWPAAACTGAWRATSAWAASTKPWPWRCSVLPRRQ